MHTSPHAARSHRAARRRMSFRRRVAVALPVASLAAATALTGVSSPAHAATTTHKIYFGIDGTAPKGAPAMSTHSYAQINQSVPTARMITMGSAGLHWTAITAAGPGSSAYTNLVRWADTLKTRPGPIFLTFSHEPEAAALRSYGTASQYVAAFRHVVSIFRAQGVTNVQWTWQMTAYAFVVPTSDSRAATKWYPGDAYVDDVGTDPYDWSDCRGGAMRQLSEADGPAVAFAKAHGKGAVLGEFAAGVGSQRAQWLRNAEAFMIANASVFRAAYYFDEFDSKTGGCNWVLSSSADLSALYAIARDPHFTA
jgi:Glycosyl hydrolase family 26